MNDLPADALTMKNGPETVDEIERSPIKACGGDLPQDPYFAMRLARRRYLRRARGGHAMRDMMNFHSPAKPTGLSAGGNGAEITQRLAGGE